MFDKFKKKKIDDTKMTEEDSELAINSILGDQSETPNKGVKYDDTVDEDDDDGIIGDLLGDEPSKNEDKYIQKESEEEEPEENEDDYIEQDDGKIDSSDPEIDVYDIKHIEKLTKKEKKRKKSGFSIIKGILIAIPVILILGIVLIMILPTPQIPGEEPINPPITSVPPAPDEGIEVGENNTDDLTQYGEVRRIMQNKVIIKPDNALSDAIYYITNKTNENAITGLAIGDRIDYTYFIENSKNVLKDARLVYKGTVMSIDENTVSLENENGTLSILGFTNSLKDTFKQIATDDIIEYSLQDDSTISSVANIIKGNGVVVTGKPSFVKDEGQVIITDFNPDDWTAEYEAIENAVPNPDYFIDFDSDFENNSVIFYNEFDTPIWIRFAWRINEYTPSVPSVSQVGVSFVTPDGDVINSDNISDYGRMWVDGNIINFALEKGVVGEWTLRADKNIGFYLGETQFMLMSLTGFITVDKFGINNLGNSQLDFIWNIGGVEDENYEIKIEVRGEKYSTTLYTASSKTKDLKLIDHVVLNAKSLPKGVYDVYVTVKDLDIYTADDENAPEGVEIEEHVRRVAAETIIHEYNAGKLTIN